VRTRIFRCQVFECAFANGLRRAEVVFVSEDHRSGTLQFLDNGGLLPVLAAQLNAPWRLVN
jgi:hypothetical protein